MKNFLLALLFVQFVVAGTEANTCNCLSAAKKIKAIQLAFDKNKMDSLSLKINELPSNDASCALYKQVLKLQLSCTTDNSSESDSLAEIIVSDVTASTCPEILCLYNYCKGMIYFKKSEGDSALAAMLVARDIAKSEGDKVMEAKVLGRVAHIFNTLLEQPEKGLTYINLAINIAQQTENNELLLLLMANKLSYFGRIFDLRDKQNYLDSIIVQIRAPLHLAYQINSMQRVGQFHSIIAGVLYYQKKYKESLIQCDSGIFVLNRKSDFRNLHALYYKKSDNYIALKDYSNARLYADTAYQFAIYERNVISMANAYERLYEVEKLTGNFEKALGYYEKYMQIEDSIISVEKNRTTNELEQKYNKVQNEKIIEELSQQKKVSELQIRVLVLLALLIVSIVFVLYRQNSTRTKMNIIEAEQRLNRARMDPHFFFNALSSLQGLANDDMRKNEVSQYISRFSKIMRQSLESSYTEMETVEDEIEFLTNYLELQKLRTGNKFSYHFTIDPALDINEVLLPGMILQPFIENSIEHGFRQKPEGGVIQVVFKAEGKQLYISIEDNGSGLKSDESHKTYVSRATQISRDRFFLLNKKYKTNAKFELVELQEGSGTKVEIRLPMMAK